MNAVDAMNRCWSFTPDDMARIDRHECTAGELATARACEMYAGAAGDRDNAVMFLRRCLSRLSNLGDNTRMADQANAWLARRGLAGSPLRGEGAGQFPNTPEAAPADEE